jgi:hypothetical protein
MNCLPWKVRRSCTTIYCHDLGVGVVGLDTGFVELSPLTILNYNLLYAALTNSQLQSTA